MNSILGALKYIPASVAQKALGKFNPKFNNYFTEALSYGIDATRALDFLSERFGNPNQKEYENNLNSEGARPDEMVSRSQRANQKIPGKIVRSAIGIGAGALAGGIGSSDSVESPVSPIIEQPAKQKPQSTLGREVLEEQSGDMFDPSDALKAFEQLVSQGESPDRAAKRMSTLPKFRSIIPRIEKDSGMSFADWAIQNLEMMQNGRQEQNGQNQGQKQSFLAELGKMNQMLQGLKR